MPGKVTARAHANIALVKYWGKRSGLLNLPAAGSLSLTLDALATTTSVEFADNLDEDQFVLNGEVVRDTALARLSAWLDLVRARAGTHERARVESSNNFPTASGLASSASAYAALAVAATAAAGVDLSDRELSILARRGSGSAARSIFGGFVLMHAGHRDDGSDSYAEPLAAGASWPVRMVIAVVGGGVKKKVSSRMAMQHCTDTSPLYRAWLDTVPSDITAARAAIEREDFHGLGEVCEASALAMHASALAARPGICYFAPGSIAAMEAVRTLRAAGVPAYFTMDAGPHVKVLTLAEAAEQVKSALADVDGVTDVIISSPGGKATVVGA